jgi:hypothetical protein
LSSEGWIKVEERLPKDGEKVLCLGVKGGMFIGSCHHLPRIFEREKGQTELEWYAKGHYCPKVVAWVPIPTVPEELVS